jgi:hypothetical protein
MSQKELDRLVAEGAIAPVAADPETARVELEQARLHLESAAAIAERDPVAAFALGYDAIRKALTAHMRSRGYRVTRGKGHHARIGRYAIAAIADARVREHLEAFEELRQLRNQAEYDAVVVRSEDVSEVLARGDGIIIAVDESL